MKQFPLSPYHQFSNSSLNSDFYDRYLSHDGHQPLQTPLIGIERTQDLLSLKLPPHGPGDIADQDSTQRPFPKEWSFATTEETTKHEHVDDQDQADDREPEEDRDEEPEEDDEIDESGDNQEEEEEDEEEDDEDDVNDSDSRSQSPATTTTTTERPNETEEKKQEKGDRKYAISSLMPRPSLLGLQHHQQLARGGLLGLHQPSSDQTPVGFFFRYQRSSSSDLITKARVQQRDSRQRSRPGADDNEEDNSSKAQDIFSQSMKHFNPLKSNSNPNNNNNNNNPAASTEDEDVVCYDLRSKNSSPQRAASDGGGGRNNPGGNKADTADNATSLSQQYHGQESCFGLDPSKQRFQYVLAAPISVATKLNEDTMTYLNQGQAYEIKLGNVTDVAEARKGFMCSIINIGFHERHMQQAENELWQQWSQQHPNEKIFSVDMKLSYNVYGVDSDGLNKYEFLWDSSKAAGVFIRINSISTEFTPKKHGGEKGVPFRLSIETFSYNSKTHDSYFISAASCQIKVFKPKGAERKIRSDRDKIFKRPPSEQDKYHHSCDHTTFTECSLTSLHPMADSSLCYYRHSHGHFASKQTSISSNNGGGGGVGGGSGNGSGSSVPAHRNSTGSGHNSDDDLEQQQQLSSQRTNNSGDMDQAPATNNNNRNSTTSNGDDRESPSAIQQQQHQHQLNSIRLSLQTTAESPYTTAASTVVHHHRLSASSSSVHHSYRHDHLDTHHTSLTHLQQPDQYANNQQHQHQASPPNMYQQQESAATNQPRLVPATINSAAQHFHAGMTAAHYYSHPALPAALVPPHHHHAHMTPTSGPYGLAPNPMSAAAAAAAVGPGAASHFPQLANPHHPGLAAATTADVKTSIYRHHQQLVDPKQPFGSMSYGAAFKSHHNSAATAAAAAAAAAAANLGQQLNSAANYQSYFATSSSTSASTTTTVAATEAATEHNCEPNLPHPHEQHHSSTASAAAKDHHSPANNNNSTCYDNYPTNNTSQQSLHSMRQRSASTSLAGALVNGSGGGQNCPSQYGGPARHHHLDNYFMPQANSNDNPSPSGNSNQWNNQANNYNQSYSASNADCCGGSNNNIQAASESPSSCCSRYRNDNHHHHQPSSSYLTTTNSQSNESVNDFKCSPTSGGGCVSHITINSSCLDVVSWFASNRFGVLAKTFNNFSGADLLRLSKTELIEICGLIEGIRLYNSLHNQPIKPRRVLYVCLETDDIYHPVYLYDLTLDELLGEISLILDTTQEDNLDHHPMSQVLEPDESPQQQQQTGNNNNKTTNSTTSSSSSSSASSSSSSGSSTATATDSRSSSRPLSAEMNVGSGDDYHDHQYFEDVHGSSSGQDNNNNKSSQDELTSNQQTIKHQIGRLLVDGVASVKVAATEKVVQMLEDESVWTLSVQTRLSGITEACITACRASHKRHCKS